MDKIKNIKCEVGTEKGDWCKIDHSTLPDGVRYEKKNIEYTYKTGKSEMREFWDNDLMATTTEEVSITATSTYNFTGRNLGASVQFNLKAIQELLDRIEMLENKVNTLKRKRSEEHTSELQSH